MSDLDTLATVSVNVQYASHVVKLPEKIKHDVTFVTSMNNGRKLFKVQWEQIIFLGFRGFCSV